MAETPSKRPREETHLSECEDPKHHKSYNHILSLLEDEEEADEPDRDFSSILTTLQRELSCDSATFDDPLSFPSSETDHDGDILAASSEFSPSSHGGTKADEGVEDERVRVMRHLLEASDDELGIPNRADGGVCGGGEGEVAVDGGDDFSVCEGLWEFEDEAANYYSLLQSELFM